MKRDEGPIRTSVLEPEPLHDCEEYNLVLTSPLRWRVTRNLGGTRCPPRSFSRWLYAQSPVPPSRLVIAITTHYGLKSGCSWSSPWPASSDSSSRCVTFFTH